MFFQSDLKFSARFTNVGFITVLAWDLVNHLTFVLGLDFVLLVDQKLSQCLVWFDTGPYPMVLEDSLDGFSGTLYVR